MQGATTISKVGAGKTPAKGYVELHGGSTRQVSILGSSHSLRTWQAAEIVHHSSRRGRLDSASVITRERYPPSKLSADRAVHMRTTDILQPSPKAVHSCTQKTLTACEVISMLAQAQAQCGDMVDSGLQGTASSRPAGSMTIIHKADKRKGAAPARAAPPEMDRMVANCLCCGKVYDCRESSSTDVRMFVGQRLLLLVECATRAARSISAPRRSHSSIPCSQHYESTDELLH